MKTIIVTAAVIIHNGEILCMQRNHNKHDYISYKYEFPGGKVNLGESNEEALVRELKEELEIELNLTAKDFFMTVNHTYPDFSIIMHVYRCLVCNRNFTMTEHINYQWLKPEELDRLDWAAADLPIVKKLMENSDE